MNMKRITIVIICIIAGLTSCMKDGLAPALPENGRIRGISVRLGYDGYGDGSATRSSAGAPALFSRADYDRVELAVMDGDGRRVRDVKIRYDAPTSSVYMEALREGRYELLILGIKGNADTDGAAIHDMETASDTWISFPESHVKPLSAEYFHSSTPFIVNEVMTADGIVFKAEIPETVIQRRIIGKLDFPLEFRNGNIQAGLEAFGLKLFSPVFHTAMSGSGEFSGSVSAEEFSADILGNASLLFLPSVPEAGGLKGETTILTRDYRGKYTERTYSFVTEPVKRNVATEVVTDAVHPDDDNGTMFITQEVYDKGSHGAILQDDEHHTVYTDKSERKFNTAEPLQLSVTDDGKLHVRFYSPRPLAEVLVKARIPASGDEYFDLAWFDNIPAFADFTETLPMTQRRTWYRTESGKIMEIPQTVPEDLSGMEFRIESSDPYWSKLEGIVHGWTIAFDLYGGNPEAPDGGPQGNWMGIRPVHCREAVAFFLNFTYMIDMPEHERILRENQDKLYGNGGVDDKVSVETVLSQMRRDRSINVGLVYTGNNVLGLGGGSTFGAYQGGWFEHYTSAYACSVMFHELGHVMGYNHSSSFTYGPWAESLMNNFYVTHLNEMPIDSPAYLDSKLNPNKY